MLQGEMTVTGWRRWAFPVGCLMTVFGTVGMACFPLAGPWTVLNERVVLSIVTSLAVLAATGAMLAVVSLRRA